jgi:hypothetical protein
MDFSETCSEKKHQKHLEIQRGEGKKPVDPSRTFSATRLNQKNFRPIRGLQNIMDSPVIDY